MKLVDLKGLKINKLIVLYRSENIGKESIWMCRCDCGKTKPIYGRQLRSGKVIDCGCGKSKRHAKSKWGHLNPNYKKDIKEQSARDRAEKWFKNRPCQICGSINSEIHHIDGIPSNNKLSNIMFVCRKHHMEIDGRLKKISVLNLNRDRDENGRYVKACR